MFVFTGDPYFSAGVCTVATKDFQGIPDSRFLVAGTSLFGWCNVICDTIINVEPNIALPENGVLVIFPEKIAIYIRDFGGVCCYTLPLSGTLNKQHAVKSASNSECM